MTVQFATWVPVSRDLLADFTDDYLPLWVTRELGREVTQQLFGESWYSGRGELLLVELGFVPRWDSTFYEDEECCA